MKRVISMFNSAWLIALCTLMLLVPATAQAEVPMQVNYQGSLSDSTGLPDDFADADHGHTLGADDWVNESGDTMFGPLNLPLNGLVAGTDQLVLSSGRVGIGTSTPAQMLHVDGTSRLAPSAYQYAQVGQNSGRLQLYLYDGSTAAPRISMGGGAGTATLETVYNMGLNIDVNADNRLFKLRTKGAVSGSIFDRMTVQAGADTADIAFMGSRVGIGVSSPDEALEVAGNVKVSGNLQVEGTTNIPVANFDDYN